MTRKSRFRVMQASMIKDMICFNSEKKLHAFFDPESKKMKDSTSAIQYDSIIANGSKVMISHRTNIFCRLANNLLCSNKVNI